MEHPHRQGGCVNDTGAGTCDMVHDRPNIPEENQVQLAEGAADFFRVAELSHPAANALHRGTNVGPDDEPERVCPDARVRRRQTRVKRSA